MTQRLDLPTQNLNRFKSGKLRRWMLACAFGAFVLAASPAQAARLDSWRFERDRNQLTFTTNGGVQPTAQLLSNPTRLVIDLPGTRLGRRTVRESVGGTIREIRVGQFNSQTSRIVVELADGYTLDPQQIQFRGSTASQWTVQLGTPQREVATAPIPDPAIATPSITEAKTLLRQIEVSDRGFILQTSGPTPQIELKRSGDRSWVSVDLPGVTLSPELVDRFLNVNRLGVERLEVIEASNSPPLSRVILNLSDPNRNWQAQVSDRGAIAVWPQGETPPTPTTPTPALATINGIEFSANGSEISVKADRPVAYRTAWDPDTLAYKITLFSSQLAQPAGELRPQSASSVLWVRTIQQDPETVVVLVQPAAGIQIAGVRQSAPELLSVQLQSDRVAPRPSQPTPVAVGENPRPIPVPAPTPTSAPPRNNPSPTTSPVPNRRIVIAVDAGHGGSDPGAIGIGGLREKEVVLDIARQVSAILEQNGITVVMTRQDDRTIDLAPRTQIANRIDANLFVSIHANAINMSRPDVNGLETYYYQSGQRLAQYIHNSVLQTFTDMRNRGVRRARFYVLRHSDMPAVLVETGFVTGRDDARRLASASDRTRMAEAIARGILQYVRDNL